MCQYVCMSRAENRVEITRTIQTTARRHLADVGPAALSLRAIAREVGMVSSAVYRYFPSRDDLLTALIIEAYDELGDAVEQADAGVRRRSDLDKRFLAVCGAIHDWARANPHEYALLYGSPVPGYSAPQDTTGPAGRVAIVLAGVVRDGLASGAVTPPRGDDDATIAPGLLDELGLPAGTGLGGRLVLAWSGLFGAIGFELFGHTHNVVVEHEEHFRSLATRLAAEVGLSE